jgi:hypothetical protein
MSWDDLLGERTLDAIRTDVRHPFDTDAAGVALDLGGLTVFIFEDPSDGYRSCSAEPLIVKAPLYSFGVSPDYIRVPVRVSRWTKGEREGEADGLEFTDRRNGKVVLRVGTDNTDDYYPSFVCDWRPQNLADNAAVETPQ